MTREKILVVDDDHELWTAYKTVLTPAPLPKTDLNQLIDLFDDDTDEKDNDEDVLKPNDHIADYDLSFFSQGENAYKEVLEKKSLSQFYAVAFIDIRMPPGWDGIETAKKIRELDPDIEIVIVTAYADVSRSHIVNKIGHPEKLLYLRKPFDNDELAQIALQLTTKWQLYKQEQQQQGAIKRLLNENLKMRKYLDGMINSMPSMLIGVTGEGWITHWNTQTEIFTGLSYESVFKQPIEQVLPVLEGINDLIYRAVIRSTTETKEKFNFHFHDKSILCDIIIYPISITEESSILKNSAVIRIDDISERVKLEEALLQTDKMLMVGGLAAGMAHEINTPLGSIMQNAQVITNRVAVDNKKNQQQAEACNVTMEIIHDYLQQRGIIQLLDGIRECGGRTSKLVKSMLSFSHQSSSTMVEKLSDLIDEAINLSMNDYDMKKNYHFRDFDIQTQYDTEMEAIACKKTKLEQVIMNLLRNAAQSMKDMPESHQSKIHIRLYQENNHACIEIKDNGPGISDENKKRIFEPFFTTKEVGIGTGIGLSLSYFIVTKDHNGSIQVVSELGKGTCFTIKIPYANKNIDYK
ncbi:hybrid sensor histidine kinase/response regulator [sulfur-oxidizing endosymbiont of Gigantopelta aegis]|uniref:hybrid sensor histidine kinase/response regulator n=1 Tax=sulfur-oxidizing endosymbiont of Gigantopelta aegis TaxID=2794934 RepID=UPI0018DB3165|nr:ATP-binding protein [sulfur-oxidizing endosymbiont of Gigantopelta aegis]